MKKQAIRDMAKSKARELSRVRNKLVEFGSQHQGVDESGFPVDEWQPFKKSWVSVRGLRGKEFFEASAVQAQDTKIFNCTYFEGLTPDMFIKFNGKLYNIKSINNLYERNTEYEIYASEVSLSG